MNTQAMSQMEELLQSPAALLVPALGEAIEGTVLSADRREVRIDIRGVMTGVVRGRELFAESDEFRTLKTGDTVEATVIDMENENGELELSFRYAGNRKAWEKLREAFTKGENAEVIVKDANKGGLLVTLGHIRGFLPVSQLSPDNYPRVSGGDKQKILEKLKTFVGQKFHVRVLDVNEDDEKLIVSEKALWEEKQQSKLTQYKVGSMIEGEVTALADFGAFVKFDALEGLVHISEIGWQRIDHPKDILKVGEVIKAEIIGIEGSKIFLSMKKLVADPWRDVEKKYAIGSTVEGKILKVNPFGFFVELDPDIHGLAHVSELSSKPVKDIESIGKEGDVLTFKIVSIEPKEHRLGLSLKALGAPANV
ncbi:MAG: RNA binding S1 domain protein [Parcubacteria group bacterium GW2011_GWA2_56_7]|nr:MAG: RNA binding S1 domain protein [Parcubacteria group bacterium GW2011_GWA2_56_7]